MSLQVMFGDQSAWGTAAVTPDQSLPVTNYVTFAINEDPIESQRINASGAENLKKKGKVNYGFTIESELDASDHLYPFSKFFGDYAFTADTPEAGANSHALNLATTKADKDELYRKGFTVEAGREDTFDTGDSSVISDITLTSNENGLVNVTTNGMCRAKAEDTSSNGSYAPKDNTELVCINNVVLKSGVDASEVTMEWFEFSLAFMKSLTPRYRALTLKQWDWANFITVEGSFKIGRSDTERAAVLDDWINSDSASIVITLDSGIVAAGATNKQIVIDIPKAKYVSPAPETDENEFTETYSFVAGAQATTDDVVTVTFINTEATL